MVPQALRRAHPQLALTFSKAALLVYYLSETLWISSPEASKRQYPDSIAKFELVKKYSRDARVLARAQQGIKQAQIASAG